MNISSFKGPDLIKMHANMIPIKGLFKNGVSWLEVVNSWYCTKSLGNLFPFPFYLTDRQRTCLCSPSNIWLLILISMGDKWFWREWLGRRHQEIRALICFLQLGYHVGKVMKISTKIHLRKNYCKDYKRNDFSVCSTFVNSVQNQLKILYLIQLEGV